MPSPQPMPTDLRPMLATAGTLPLADDRFAFEFKWDGVRAVAHVDGGTARVLSRGGHDVAGAYPELAGLWHRLAGHRIVLDGEVVAFDPATGRISFSALQPRMHVTDRARARRLGDSNPVSYFVFDLLHLDGHSLLGLTYPQRREVLDGLRLAGPRWAVPPSFTGGGPGVLAASVDQGLEGVVAKSLTSTYVPGRRTADWVKVKNVRTQEVLVGGWTAGQGNRTSSIGALLMGIPSDDGLRYVGNVGSGFSQAALRDLLTRLEPLRRPTSPFGTPVPAVVARAATWTDPRLVGEVAYAERTQDGRLRHPTWRGLRPDKHPDEVVVED